MPRLKRKRGRPPRKRIWTAEDLEALAADLKAHGPWLLMATLHARTFLRPADVARLMDAFQVFWRRHFSGVVCCIVEHDQRGRAHFHFGFNRVLAEEEQDRISDWLRAYLPRVKEKPLRNAVVFSPVDEGTGYGDYLSKKKRYADKKKRRFDGQDLSWFTFTTKRTPRWWSKSGQALPKPWVIVRGNEGIPKA